MKKRSAILSLVLALAMVACMFTSVFAAGAPTKHTKNEIKKAEVQSVTTLKNEVDAEAFAKALSDQVKKGKYKLVDTATLKSWIDGKKSMVIVDVMPEGWWAQRHIPGAICQIVGADNKPEFKILSKEKTALLKKVKAKCTVTKYYNTKTKKWQTKKIAGAKTKKVVDKKKTVVVYCGFTKCQRSHQAAMYLKSKGFKNVYRYAGGISAWVDANNDIEGTDVDK